ncbi:MAG: FAD:protein FMN transferase [Lachnospiraceae bacterium]|nr:FAD:protein FMN transferase [Lachnospiraceae bacterium]
MRNKLILCVLIFILLAGCGGKDSDTAAGYALDTVVSVTVYDGQPADKYIEKIGDYEKLFSKTVQGSDIDRINNANGGPVQVSAGTIEMLKRCEYYYEVSGGKIDPTIGGVTKLWDFQSGKIPDKDAINEALKHVGFDKVVIDGNTVTLKDTKTELDLGFIAKGYIAGRLTADENSSILVNLGGNIAFNGEKPDSKPFKIGIEKPFSGGKSLVTMDLNGKNAVVTSGIYQRYFEKDGKIYHHILDAKTGYPVENDLYSVTIVMENATEADALSTTCYALGAKEGMELVENTPGAEAMFIDKNMNIKVSSGFPKYQMADE